MLSLMFLFVFGKQNSNTDSEMKCPLIFTPCSKLRQIWMAGADARLFCHLGKRLILMLAWISQTCGTKYLICLRNAYSISK